MPHHSYRLHYDRYGNTREIVVTARGSEVYDNSYTNKGTAFTEEERGRFSLHGTLPPRVRSLAQQVENCRQTLERKNTDLEKFIYIRSLFDRNVTLAHA